MKKQQKTYGAALPLLIVGTMTLVATEALAQTPGVLPPAEQAAANIIQTGVLGSMLIIVMFVALKLWQRTEAMQKEALATAETHRKELSSQAETHRKEMVEVTKEQSKLLAENNLLSKRQIDLMERVVERASDRA